MTRPLPASVTSTAVGLVLLLCPLMIGCATPTYTFQVAVRNETKEPITLWLTKDGPPPEAGWMSPEQLARTPYDPAAVVPAVILAPGTARGTSPLKGQFPAGTHAVLRVYRGAMQKMSQILATPRNEPSVRLDLILQHDGVSEFVVGDDNGHLTTRPPDRPFKIEPAPAASSPPSSPNPQRTPEAR